MERLSTAEQIKRTWLPVTAFLAMGSSAINEKDEHDMKAPLMPARVRAHDPTRQQWILSSSNSSSNSSPNSSIPVQLHHHDLYIQRLHRVLDELVLWSHPRLNPNHQLTLRVPARRLPSHVRWDRRQPLLGHHLLPVLPFPRQSQDQPRRYVRAAASPFTELGV